MASVHILRRRLPQFIAVSGVLTVACATTKAPTLQVEAVRIGKLGITGAGLEVGFRVQNREPEPMVIERFEYELKLNGRSVGRGYGSEPLRLDGFEADRVRSSFNLSFLRMPSAVRRILDQDRAKADVKGHFYVRDHDGDLKKLRLKGSGDVDLRR
jgi:LEA14-like dessication related protein